MSSSSGSARGARFTQRVQQLGELRVTVLASSKLPMASSESSTLAAQRLVGGLYGKQSDRIDRLAAKLDRLVAADRGSDECPKTAVG
jgi:hypothetical protein